MGPFGVGEGRGGVDGLRSRLIWSQYLREA